MRKLQKRLKRAIPTPSVNLRLENLEQRLMLSISADWVFSGDISDFSAPASLPGTGGGNFGVWNDYSGQEDNNGYIAPSVMSINDDPETFGDHPVTCTCPLCAGLVGNTDTNVTNMDALTSGGGDNADSSEDSSLLYATGGDPYTLYLDFDGAQVFSRTGDFWLGSQSVDIPAYDLSMYGWSGREQESINYITQFVAEDYAAYNISITTTEPTVGEYTTMYIGGTNDWFRPSSGVIGVATYDIQNRDASNYGFAFSEELTIYYNSSGGNLRNFSEYLANLITHESGHTYGANHVSDPSAIMNPYLATNPRRTMFGQGPIPGSYNTQDTQSLMGDNLGFSHGPDDFGNNYSTAANIDDSGPWSGLLERRDDVDAFTFTAAVTGTAEISTDTHEYANLNSYLTVYRNSDYSIIAQNDDYAGLRDSYTSIAVVAGESYTVYVSSSSGNSSGNYTLSLELPDPNPQPQIQVTDNQGDPDDLTIDFGSLVLGDSQSAAFVIANQGNADLVISELTATGIFNLDRVSLGSVGSDDITIAPQAEQSITVTFNPNQVSLYDGTVTIVSNDPAQDNIILELSGAAHIHDPDIVTVDAIDFGDVLRGDTVSRILTIHNDSVDPLTIDDIDITAPFILTGGFDGSGLVVAPYSSVDLTLDVSYTQRGPLEGEIVIYSNDPQLPSVSVDLAAQVVAGILEVVEVDGFDDGLVDMGTVITGQTYQAGVWQLRNQGNIPVNVAINISGGNSFETADSQPVNIQPGDSYTVELLLNPAIANLISETITLTADDINATTSSLVLTADAYALVTAGNPYKFYDLSGDYVTIAVTGSVEAHVTVGTDGQPDIQVIDIVSADSTDKLKIKVQGSGTTSLGEITGTDSLKSINAKKVDLIGAGIDLDGTLQKLDLGTVLGGANIAFAAQQPAVLNFNQIIGNTNINIDGPVGRLHANHFLNGSLQAESISSMKISGYLNADIQIDGNLDNLVVRKGNLSGELNINGTVGKVAVKDGDIPGNIFVAHDINRISAAKGTISGTLKSGAVINKISAAYLNQTDIFARDGIDQIRVRHDMLDTMVTIGYDAQAAQNQSASALPDVDAYLGSLKVRGTFAATTVAVGVAPGDEGNFINGIAHTNSGNIGNLFLHQVVTNNSTDPFGIVAQDKIDKLRINRQRLNYDYQQENFYITVIDK